MGVVLYELCNLQHAFQGEVSVYPCFLHKVEHPRNSLKEENFIMGFCSNAMKHSTKVFNHVKKLN